MRQSLDSQFNAKQTTKLDSDAVVYRCEHLHEPPLVLLLAAALCSLFALVGNHLNSQTIDYSDDISGISLKSCLALLWLCFLHLIIRRRTHDSLASCILLIASSYAVQNAWRSLDQSITLTLFTGLLWILDQAFANHLNYKGHSQLSRTTNQHWLMCEIPIVAAWSIVQRDFLIGILIPVLFQTGKSIAAPSLKLKHNSLTIQLYFTTCTLLWMLLGAFVAELPPISIGLSFLLMVSILLSKKPKDLVESFAVAILVTMSLAKVIAVDYLVVALTAWASPHLRSACQQIQSFLSACWPKNLEPASATNTPIWTKSSIATHAFVRNNRWLHLWLTAVCYWFAVLVFFCFFA